jgi:hypothetical protein
VGEINQKVALAAVGNGSVMFLILILEFICISHVDRLRYFLAGRRVGRAVGIDQSHRIGGIGFPRGVEW